MINLDKDTGTGLGVQGPRSGCKEGPSCQVSFLASWASLSADPGANTYRHIPYSAWGVKPSKEGLGRWGIQLPECLRHPNVYVSPVRNGDELREEFRTNDRPIHYTMSPAGSIMDVHSHNVLSAIILVQLYGEKILLTWETTEANRIFFSNCQRTEHSLSLRTAIERMPDGFKANILKPGVGVKLEPGMMHAVIYTTNSAIGHWEYVDAKWLETRKIEDGVKWEVGLIKTREIPSILASE